MALVDETGFWRRTTAPNAAVLIDAAAYYAAAMAAMETAQRSIHFLNWAFEPETRMRPRADNAPSEDIATALKRLARAKPGLDIRILCWESALPVAATQHFFPILDRNAFRNSGVTFVLDGKLPVAACHHQKLIVIDGSLAFCGGADIGQDRWDTPDHTDDDPRRRDGAGGPFFDSRHEVMAMVDGDAAAALGQLFRDRWLRRTGEALPPTPSEPPAPWPAAVAPTFSQVQTSLSRTRGAWRKEPETRECERAMLAGIRAARRCIYMENQYFTSELVAEAMIARLEDPAGPEVVLISTGHSPSYFDRLTMDPTRSRFIARLQSADRHGRFRIYSPVTALGRIIIVHAKVTIIDDGLVRIGSANMNNRSLGLDTECDLTLESDEDAASESREAIAALRTTLLAHWLGCGTATIETAMARENGVGRAIDALRDSGLCRLRPIAPVKLHLLAALIARLHIGDPMSPRDTFRPWKRKAALVARLKAAGLQPR